MRNGYTLKCASKTLKNDKEVVLEAVKPSGLALEDASKIFQMIECCIGGNSGKLLGIATQ